MVGRRFKNRISRHRWNWNVPPARLVLDGAPLHRFRETTQENAQRVRVLLERLRSPAMPAGNLLPDKGTDELRLFTLNMAHGRNATAHQAFLDLRHAPGSEENFRLRGSVVEYAVIHRFSGEVQPFMPNS